MSAVDAIIAARATARDGAGGPEEADALCALSDLVVAYFAALDEFHANLGPSPRQRLFNALTDLRRAAGVTP